MTSAPNGSIRRLFFDLETSPNIGLFWQPGHEISVGYESIIKERGIICAAWKWEGEKEVHSLSWTRDEQDDRRVVAKVSALIQSADEVVSHNGDRFDIPWVRGRALRLGYPFPPRLVSQDTCALSRRLFNLNSHRLDYLAKYLGIGGKLPTGYDLWKKVLLDKDGEALDKMLRYCEQDVRLLERVWKRMMPFVPAKTHATGLSRQCPECGKDGLIVRKHRTTASGAKQVQLSCPHCGKYTSMSLKQHQKSVASR